MNNTLCGLTRADIIWAALLTACALKLGIGWEWAMIVFGVIAAIRDLAAKGAAD